MEIIIVLFLGCWLAIAGVLAYRQLKKDLGANLDGGDQEE